MYNGGWLANHVGLRLLVLDPQGESSLFEHWRVQCHRIALLVSRSSTNSSSPTKVDYGYGNESYGAWREEEKELESLCP